ncbi:MAG TPA: outer membrane lipid asymmetry maintenance protein MlaD [Chromatiales bacterium]|nr:outer membrane lipid asymmetry maintenance protein MlaD [Chromatiales bacterium]
MAQNKRILEVSVGAFMLIGMVALFFLAMQVSNLSSAPRGDGYEVTARFDNIGSLKVRAPVTMAGVVLGRVVDIDFDDETYEAVVTMRIQSKYDHIPEDTFAKIYTAGLLGEQYIGLDPGGSDTFLKDGGQITLTQSSIVLEEIIGQFLFNKAEEGGDK